ncbi:MAG: tetratricopeptide repeat protein [Candidatus Firestonebacteria bacterium]
MPKVYWTTLILSILLLFVGVYNYFTNKDIKERRRKRRERTNYLNNISQQVKLEKIPINEGKLEGTICTVEDYKEYLKEIGLANNTGLKTQWLISNYYLNLLKTDLKYAETTIMEYYKVVEGFEKMQKSLNRILFSDNYLFADESLFQIGNIYFYELLDMQKTFEIYQEFLKKYPLSEKEEDAKHKIYLIQNNSDFNFVPLQQYAVAEKHENEGIYEEAIKVLSESINNYPDCKLKDDILFKIGSVYQSKIKDYNKAILSYQRLIDEHKESDLLTKCYDFQGVCYMALSQWEAAENCYEIILSISKDVHTTTRALFQTILCHENLGELEAALNVIHQLKEYPKNVWTESAKMKEDEILEKISSKNINWIDFK